MKRIFILSATVALATAIAQTPEPMKGQIVPKAGEKPVSFLAFKDQVAADAGRDTKPVSVSVNKGGTFVYPESVPVGFTLATTPPCVDLEAILVKSAKGGVEPVNLLDQFKSGNTGTASGMPKLGQATQIKTDQFDVLNGLFHFTTQTTLTANKINSTDGVLGIGKFGLGIDSTSLIGGVNLGCRNEKKPTGGAQ